MHSCLRVPELLQLVFSNLFVPSSHPEATPPPAELAALARTCQYFQTPALIELWKHVPLFAVLSLWPRDLWDAVVIRRHSEFSSQLVLRRAILPSDWERVRFYQTYIQGVYYFGGSSLTPCLDDIFPVLREEFPVDVLPNLRSVAWDDYYSVLLQLKNLLRSTLTRVSFDAYKLPTSLPIVLVDLQTSCPSLSSINLSGFEQLHERFIGLGGHAVQRVMEAVELDAISDFVTSQSRLRRLSVPSLTRAAFYRLPNLVALDIDFLPRGFVSPLDLSTLRKLSLRFSGVERVIPFLRVLRTPQLSVLRALLTADPFPTAAQLDELYTSLPPLLLPASTNTTLCTVQVTIVGLHQDSETGPRAYDQHTLPASTFRSLVAPGNGLGSRKVRFSALRALTLSAANFGPSLDDAAISLLADACPMLEELILLSAFIIADGESYTVARPQCTLCCLASIRRACPFLRALTIFLDADASIPTLPWPAPPTDSRGRHPLSSLNVQHSPLSSDSPTCLARIAKYIRGMFPRLREITTSREYEINSESDEDWEDGNSDSQASSESDAGELSGGGSIWERREREARAVHRRWKVVESLVVEEYS